MSSDRRAGSASLSDAALRCAMLLMVVVCAGLWLWGGEVVGQADETPALPAAWDDGVVRCPAGADEGSRAKVLAAEAETMWERSFFDWSDGPRAVVRLSQAAACARASGDLGALDRDLARVEEWKQHVQRLQDREALRLELAERRQDPEAMQRHAERLDALLRDGDPERVGEARGWLSRSQRRARALLAGSNEREEVEDE